ncbi:hypothetical protein MLD38_016279 [Melastoma candidum]|uniref:Uncharacterized protein n=1 Tax=Melastoma candidum TaxID=119954 RepID=A0ACB9RIM9_9MYRT|nr:hypothetical protein MLD38_016279 [Melastoma candidum]
MAQPFPPPVAVVSPHFCAPYPVDLAIVRKVMTIADGSFVVTDLSDNIVFKVRGSVLSLHHRRFLLDAAGNPLLTLQQKMISAHDRWKAYRGESSDEKDLLFTVKRSSMIQLLGTKLHVFLANNTSEDRCDFRVEGSWLERSCVIYAGDSNSVIAQMHKKHTVQSMLLGKDRFMVTVYPNVDAAFVAAIIVILEEINSEDKSD